MRTFLKSARNLKWSEAISRQDYLYANGFLIVPLILLVGLSVGAGVVALVEYELNSAYVWPAVAATMLFSVLFGYLLWLCFKLTVARFHDLGWPAWPYVVAVFANYVAATFNATLGGSWWVGEAFTMLIILIGTFFLIFGKGNPQTKYHPYAVFQESTNFKPYGLVNLSLVVLYATVMLSTIYLLDLVTYQVTGQSYVLPEYLYQPIDFSTEYDPLATDDASIYTDMIKDAMPPEIEITPVLPSTE
jgi:uncharacterized membrane protein YhaH (DUF805 family)